jgi:hypothetical protein
MLWQSSKANPILSETTDCIQSTDYLHTKPHLLANLGNNILDAGNASSAQWAMPENEEEQKADSPGQKRTLPVLRAPSFKSLVSKTIRTPILPIIIGAIITGWVQDMLMATIGIATCTLWLLYDLWPWADFFSLKIATKMFSVFEGPKHSAEVFRRKRQRQIRLIIFVLMCLLASTASVIVGIGVAAKIRSKIRSETYQQLHGSLSLPQNANLNNNSKLTITNDGPYDVHMRELRCKLNYYRTVENATGSGFEIVPFSGDNVLHHGGDAQSQNCPAGNHFLGLPGSSEIYCADIVWTAKYSIEEVAENQEKKYRFVLHPGEHEWSGTPLDANVPPCS